MEQNEQMDLLPKKRINLRLQFIHRPVKKRWYVKKFPFLVQNEPFEYGLRIKNIGSEAFSGATIQEFTIKADRFLQKALKTAKIKPMNPDEEYDLYIDRYTLWHEGSIGTKCTLIPDRDGEEIQTYQYHRDHDADEPYETINEWWHDYYCQGQQQLLQSNTNKLILILTIITVIEAVLGLKESLKFIAGIVAWFLSKILWVFSWLAN